MNEPRAYTAEETRDMLLDYVRGIARYWAELPNKTAQERCDGVVFSILNIFDGSTMVLPAIDLKLAPHKDDKAYNKSEGRNWFKSGMTINDCVLHELYFKRQP